MCRYLEILLLSVLMQCSMPYEKIAAEVWTCYAYGVQCLVCMMPPVALQCTVALQHHQGCHP